MRVPLADLVAQYRSLKPEIDAAIHAVLDSGRFILGPEVAALEREVADLSGAKYGVAVNSGTDALLLALLAQGIGPGDEVITTPFTFVATIEAIAHAGATPIFADIDPITFNLCPARTAEKITPRTKAIMPVDLFGLPADRAAFLALAEEHRLKLVWDGAQSIGAQDGGKRLGEFDGAITLSFFPTKNLGACGDGGMVLTNDEAVRDHLVNTRFHGSGGGYVYSDVGYCSRLDALQAAILRVKLQRLTEWNEARRAHAKSYRALLDGTCAILPADPADSTHIYHQFTIRHPRRDALKVFLAERQVDSGIYYPLALHVQAAYRSLGYVEGDFPASERACREVLSLPVAPEVSEEQIAYVAECIREFDEVVP